MADGQHKRRGQSPSDESSPKRSKEDGEAAQGGESSAERAEEEGEAAQGAGASRSTRAAAATRQSDPPAEPQRVSISMEKQLLHCAVAECGHPLKPPIFKAGHFLCSTCRGDGPEGHSRRCDRATTFVRASPDLDTFVGAARVPCPFKEYGCASTIAYHATADHRNACQYAPCPCPVPGCPFVGSPPMLLSHLRGDAHFWQAHRMPGSGEPVSLTVAVEGDDGSLFLAFVAALGTDVWFVSGVCVRANAETGPRYKCMLWAQGKAAPGYTECNRAFIETEVPSCTDPRGAVPKVALWLRGPFTELHLRIRIDEAVGPVGLGPPSALLMH
ncbi:hypothetical protein EJB05_31827, partial [Eragrostis curvula]